MSGPRILIVDLEKRSDEAIAPEASLVQAAVGGAALNGALIGRFGVESLVFGAGPLTGTLAPAAALMVASFVPAAAGALCHVPLLRDAGPDFRRSGIDHLVLTGKARTPTLLHIDGGRVRFLTPPETEELPALVKALRRAAPPCRSTLLTAPAAGAAGAVSLGLNGSLDKAGLAGALAALNVRGILLGGSGGVAFAAGDLARSLALAERIKKERKREGGFADVVTAAGGGKTLGALKGAKLRAAACFHCGAPCLAHAQFRVADPRASQVAKEDRSVLLADHLGWIALAKVRGGAALPLVAEALRLGLDPAAAAARLPDGAGNLTADFAALAALARDGVAASPVRAPADPRFGGGLPALGTGEAARHQTALAFVLGVCPLFLQRFPWVAGELPAFLPAGSAPEAPERAAAGLLAGG